MKVVALMSGGIDSFVMGYMLQERGHEVYPLFINYGQLALEHEFASYNRVCEFLKLNPVSINISEYGNFFKSGITDPNLDVVDEAFLPNRNLLFLLLASSYAVQNEIYLVSIGIIENPIFPDQSKEFLEASEKALQVSLDMDVKVLYPLKELNKLDIYKLAYRYKLPLELVYYCHTGNSEPCNECLACREHVIARKQIKKLIEEGNIDW